MSTKEFIKRQVESTRLLTPEQFTELESENSILILEIPLKDYSLTEIARIVESHYVHVMALDLLPVRRVDTPAIVEAT